MSAVQGSVLSETDRGYWRYRGQELYRQQSPEDRQFQLDIMRKLADEAQPRCNREWAEGWLEARVKETVYRG